MATKRRDDRHEADACRDWESSPTSTGNRLDRDRTRHAARDAWHRIEHALPGGADKDGR